MTSLVDIDDRIYRWAHRGPWHLLAVAFAGGLLVYGLMVVVGADDPGAMAGVGAAVTIVSVTYDVRCGSRSRGSDAQ